MAIFFNIIYTHIFCRSTIVTPSSISPEKEKTSDDVSVTAENNADNKDTVSKNHEKPSVPSVFICPMVICAQYFL